MSSVQSGKIYCRFVRRLADGESVNFKIQSLPKGKEFEIAKYMTKYFMREEVWAVTSEIDKNSKSIEEYMKRKYTQIMNNPTLLCCVDTGDDDSVDLLKIVGCTCLCLHKKGEDSDSQAESEEMKTFIRMLEKSDDLYSIYDKYDVNEYLGGAGMFVDSKYRVCGVAKELLKARRPLCEELGISVTADIFTAVASQRAAERAGYEVVVEVDYKSFGDACGVTFKTDAPSFKIQAMRISY